MNLLATQDEKLMVEKIYQVENEDGLKGEYSLKLNAEKRIAEIKQWDEPIATLKVRYEFYFESETSSRGSVTDNDEKKAKEKMKQALKENNLKLKDITLIEGKQGCYNEDYD